MSNIKLDIPDITVVIEKGTEYLSTVNPSEIYQVLVNTGDNYNVVVDDPATIVTNGSGSYINVADYASTASYALYAQSLVAGGTIEYGTLSASSAYFQNLTVSQSIVANSITGSFQGDGSQLTGIGVTGGTQNYVPLWTGTNALSSSLLFQTGSSLLLGATAQHTPEAPDRFGVFAGVTDSYNAVSVHGTTDNYFQLNIKNFSTGSNASADIVATTDSGTELFGYVNMGINGTGHVGGGDSIGGAGDSYLYMAGDGDLLIGNTSVDRRIILFSGPGSAINNARVFIDTQGFVGINTASPVSGAPEALAVQAIPESFNVINARASTNSYAQVNIKNDSNGVGASSDIVATADSGTEDSNYINMGINSSQFTGLIGGPNDAYLYSTGSMLHIGNATPDNHIIFFAGGSDVEANNKLTLTANNQHTLSGSLNVTGSINVLAGIVNNLTASFAMTASYVSGAASTWETLTNKPNNLVSSSLQINTGSFSGSLTGILIGTGSWATNAVSSSYAPTILPNGIVSSSTQISYSGLNNTPIGIISSSTQASAWTVASSSVAISASYAPTILPAGTVSSSTQVNYNSIQNQPTTIPTASYVLNAISSSYAFTASYVSGAASNWDTLSNKPVGLVSSSIQINTGSFSGSFTGTLIGTSSRAVTASYISPAGLPTGTVSSSIQINTGSFSGSFTGTLLGTSSWASNAITSSYAFSASYAPLILPTGIVSSSSQINTGSFTGSFVGQFNGTASYATISATSSYISGGMVIIGLPTDGAYGGSAGNVSGIVSGDKAEDALDKIELILGKLAPAKPANLSTRTLTTNATTYSAYTASGATPTLYSTVTANTRASSSWTFVAATSGSTSTLSYDSDSGTLQAELDGVVTAQSQRVLTTASDTGSYGNLIINSDLDPYNGTFGQQGFWDGFIATVAPTQSLSVGPHTARLLHSTTGNTPIFTWYVDNPSTPTVAVVTGSSTGGSTRYVSGVPTLATGETVLIATTASNAVSQFYNSTRILAAVGNNSVAPTVNATLPAVPPASASAVSASITLTVATNAYTTASTYTVTAYNSAGSTATSTWTPLTSIRVDTISNEASRARSGIGWYPPINSTVSGAGAIWTASVNLTGSRDLQMTNNIYHYPSASNYNFNYPTQGPDYRTLAAEITSSFPNEAVRWATFSGSVNAASNISIVFNNTNAAFVGTQTTGSMRLYILVSGSSPTVGWIDGATAYPGVGNPTNNGDPALDVGNSTTTLKRVTFGSIVKTGVVFVRVGIPSSSLAGSTRTFGSVTIT